MKLLKTITISVLLMVAICGCAKNKTSNLNSSSDPFLKLVSTDDVNNSLHVTIYDKQDEMKFGSEVEIVVENVSSREIFFLPKDSSAIRVFIDQNNNWAQIKNNDVYLGDGGILTQKGTLESVWKTGASPMLESGLGDIGKQATVRILVVGEFMSNGNKTGKQVAAYVDLIMIP